jgi:hypothetical protein
MYEQPPLEKTYAGPLYFWGLLSQQRIHIELLKEVLNMGQLLSGILLLFL